ncbi:hypothetical protein FBU30_007091 [Linnemannia zychae]|nr:hypothetical protein FBU30_007091 [Linnemannia zychae]
MYLAYLRCSAVFPAFRKLDWLHYFLIGFRAIELFAIIIINIVQNYLCNGSVAAGTRCAPLAIAWTFRDAGAPIFRGYYILCEGIFYIKLFRTLKGMSGGKNKQLRQYRQLQTSLFTVDLILLIFMSIYRIIGIFDKTLPTYVYIELFSSTLTIFTLTEFGLNIRILFNTVADAKTNSEATSSPSKMEMASIHPSSSGNNSHPGSSGHGTQATVSTTMGSAGLNRKSFEANAQQPYSSNRPRPLTQNSTSPLTSNAAETGYSSDYDLTGSGARSITNTNNKNNNNNNNNNNSNNPSPSRPNSPSQQPSRPSLQLQFQQQLQYNQRVIDDFQDYIPFGAAPTTLSNPTPSSPTSQEWLRSQPSNSNGGATTATSSFLRGHRSPSTSISSIVSGPKSSSVNDSVLPVNSAPIIQVVTPPARSHVRPRQI